MVIRRLISDWRVLEKQLQSLADVTNSSLRMTPSEYTGLKRERQKQGLMMPTILGVNTGPRMIGEGNFLEHMVPEMKGVHACALPVGLLNRMKRLPRYPADTLPEFSVDGPSEKYLNSYVHEVSGYFYGDTSTLVLADKALDVLDEIVSNNPELLTEESWLDIVRFYGKRYDSVRLLRVLQMLPEDGERKSCEDLAMFYIMRSGEHARIQTAIGLFDRMKSAGRVDGVTLNCIISGFKDNQARLSAVKLMDDYRIPFYFGWLFCSYSSSPYTTIERFSNHATKKELTAILNVLLVDRIHHSDFVSAFDVYERIRSQHKLQLTRRTFDIMFESLRDEYVLAFATYNWVQDNGLDIDEWDVYGKLMHSLVALGLSKLSGHWALITRYTYMKSIDPSTGETTAEQEDIDKLNLVALQRGEFGFNLKARPTLFETDELEYYLSRLRWDGREPIWDFDKNRMAFRTACYYIGMSQEDGFKILQDRTPSANAQILLDDGEFDSWVQLTNREGDRNAE